MANSDELRVKSWWDRKRFRGRAMAAFKTGLAAVLCLWLGHLFQLSHSYWAAISAIVVMGADGVMTLTSCRDRLIGTALGALIGWGSSYVWHGNYVLYGIAVMICLLACSLLEYERAGRLAAVAVTIIVLIRVDGGPGRAALARFLEVSLGIIVALAVTMLVFPERPASAEGISGSS